MRNSYSNRPGGYRSIDGFVSPARPRPVADMRPRQPAFRSSLGPRRPLELPSAPSRQEMRLPGGASRDRQFKQRRQGSRSFLKWSLRSAAAIIIVVLVIGGYLFSKGYMQLNRVFVGGSTTSLNSKVPGRINILLLGVGGEGHDGPDLTDTMMIASIDPVNNKIDLLSIPRDLWVKEPNGFVERYGKINAAYESGKYEYLGKISGSNDNSQAIDAGFQAVDQTVSHVVGVPINYNVLVDFQAFKEAVNSVGGVTIDVPQDLVDPTMAWQNHWNPVIAKAGVQHMDGVEALMYARSRETTSDFARTDRQRAILVALKDEVLTAGTLSNPLKISGLLSALGDNVRTDISLNDMEQLRQIIQKVGSSNIDSVDFDTAPHDFVTTAPMDGQSTVQPKAGVFDYSQIQAYTRQILRNGYLTKENATLGVYNGTEIPGLATDWTDTLKAAGYNVAAPANAPTETYQTTVLVDLTKGTKPYTLKDLQQRLGVKATTTLPAGITPGQANFVIILGQDEAGASS